MRSILFFVFVFSLQCFSQEEFNNSFKPIPPKKEADKLTIPPKEMSPKPTTPDLVKKEDSLPFNPNTLFMDAKLYKKPANSAGVYYKQNQYLGSFKTSSISSTIRYRDAAFLDGDKVRVWVNHKIIESEVLLDSDFKDFVLKLEKGINRIDIEALNEGFASPNTAQFEIYDDKGVAVMVDQWNVGTGYKATIMIIKE